MVSHRINLATLELRVDDRELARALIDRCSRLHETRIAPLLDRICGELSGPDRIDRIDRLELELGPLTVGDFEDDLIRKLEAALRRALGTALHARDSAARSDAPLELLATFARTGNLPWWADLATTDPVATAGATLLAAAPGALLLLLRELADDPVALARLARHLDDPTIAALVEQRWPAARRDLPLALRHLTSQLRPARPRERLRRAVLTALAGPLSAPRALRSIVRALAELPDWRPTELLQDPALPVTLRAAITPLTPVEPDPPPVDDASETTHEPTPAAAADPRPPLEPRLTAPPDPLPAIRRRTLATLGELHVEDAGLVLLWPFLDRFFIRQGLLDEARRFVDEPATMQAIALLGQLAAEDPARPEYLLSLAKVLCGRSPEQPFELERPLSPAQLDECEHLLTAVIDHATILRDMPVAEFRAAFLRRPAVLTTDNGMWRLQVQHLAHDAVLARFPWSSAWIKLPWMPGPLRVEWA